MEDNFHGVKELKNELRIEYEIRTEHHVSYSDSITFKIRLKLKHSGKEVAVGYFAENLQENDISDENKKKFIEDSISKFEKEHEFYLKLTEKNSR